MTARCQSGVLRALLLLCLLAMGAARLPAQQPSRQFRYARPGYHWQFPRDHFAHPAFADEWWYFTGNLTAADGRPFGFELTFFRIAPFPGADLQQDFYFAHFAISDLSHHGFHFHERARRGLWQQAGFQRQPSGRDGRRVPPGRKEIAGGEAAHRGPQQTWLVCWGGKCGTAARHRRAMTGAFPPSHQRRGKRPAEARGEAPSQSGTAAAFRLWTENWQLQMGTHGPERLDADWGGLSLHLQLGSSPILFNGVNGWSQKGTQLSESSYYYSLPRLPATGEIGVDGERQPAHGLVWMDHEFATNQLAPNQQGWDWMGLQLDEPSSAGEPRHTLDLMLFQLRQKDGGKDPHSSATLRVAPPATVTTLRSGDFQMTPLRWWKSPATGARYPVAWTVVIPSRQITLTVEARQDNQELRTRITGVDYWEGAVKVTGKDAGRAVEGNGYLELTGYGEALQALQAR